MLRKFSQKDIYNNSAERKLTPDDEQELKVATAYEISCKNQQHNPTRGFGNFMALFRSTRTKANFTLTEANFFRPKQPNKENVPSTANVNSLPEFKNK